MAATIATRTISGIDYPATETIKPPVLLLGNGSELQGDVAQALLAAGWPIASLQSPGAANDGIDAALEQRLTAMQQRPGHAVVMLGGEFRPGRLLDHDYPALRDKLDDDLCPQLLAAKRLLPTLALNPAFSTYLILGGPAAESPWSGYGHQSVAAAALRSFAQVLRDEMRATRVRVRQLSVSTPIRCLANREHACTTWPNTLEVAHRITGLLDAPGDETVIRLARKLFGPGAAFATGPQETTTRSGWTTPTAFPS